MFQQEYVGDEKIEVQLNEAKPAFLSHNSSTENMYASVKIFQDQEGSLSRAAALQSALNKERRQVMNYQQRTMLDSIPKDFNGPTPETGNRHLPQELKGVRLSSFDKHLVPKFKEDSLNKSSTFVQKSKLTLQEQRENLPIYKLKKELVQTVNDNQVLIVIGETGSGKTTQVAQFLAEEGYTGKGKIGITQPRMVAAKSVADRVAEEFGCQLGEEVGYSIGFEDCTSSETRIKYMTDDMLLREFLVDENLSRYSVIMLDEVHERTVHTDVLFGVLKHLMNKRPELKVIITCATLDAEKFSRYFFNCNILEGHFQVEILYTKEAESDYLDAALVTVMQIHLTEPEGDILVFLTGQEEIDHACLCLHH